MNGLVLDNSVAMRWSLQDSSTYADGVLDRLLAGGEAHVPVMWLYEVVSVLAKYQQKGTLTHEKVRGFLEDLRSLEVKVDREGSSGFFKMSTGWPWSTT